MFTLKLYSKQKRMFFTWLINKDIEELKLILSNTTVLDGNYRATLFDNDEEYSSSKSWTEEELKQKIIGSLEKAGLVLLSTT